MLHQAPGCRCRAAPQLLFLFSPASSQRLHRQMPPRKAELCFSTTRNRQPKHKAARQVHGTLYHASCCTKTPNQMPVLMAQHTPVQICATPAMTSWQSTHQYAGLELESEHLTRHGPSPCSPWHLLLYIPSHHPHYLRFGSRPGALCRTSCR